MNNLKIYNRYFSGKLKLTSIRCTRSALSPEKRKSVISKYFLPFLEYFILKNNFNAKYSKFLKASLHFCILADSKGT